MKDGSIYYGNVMKKYTKRDTFEWLVGVILSVGSVIFIYTNIFVCVALGILGVALLSYCSGKETVTMRMLNEEISQEEKDRMMQKHDKMW